jgi:hypothetical protein
MPTDHSAGRDGITRPRVIVSVTVGTRRAAAIEQRHHPTVVLEGSGTFVADDAGSLNLPDTNVPADVLWTDYLPYRSRRWFAVVDARGRVAWTHRGDETTSLLVIASSSTPLPYLAHLRQQRIPYLLAGARGLAPGRPTRRELAGVPPGWPGRRTREAGPRMERHPGGRPGAGRGRRPARRRGPPPLLRAAHRLHPSGLERADREPG